MDLATFNGRMAATSRECSRVESCTATGIMCGKTGASTKVIIDSIKSTERGLIPTQMEASTRASGRKACSMEWVAL